VSALTAGRVRLVNGQTGSGGVPRLLFRTENELADVSPDGRRFLAVKTPSETAPRRFHVVLNWSRTVAVPGQDR